VGLHNMFFCHKFGAARQDESAKAYSRFKRACSTMAS
jgi:hypothetical protein